jgi:hypothetical protein
MTELRPATTIENIDDILADLEGALAATREAVSV